MSPTYPAHARAAVAYGVAARETADAAFAAVAGCLDRDGTLQDRARRIVAVRAASALAWQRFVLTELLAAEPGEEPYAELGRVVGLNETTLRAQFEDVVAAWRADRTDPDPDRYQDWTIGLLDDSDPAGTAAMLDQWLARHREPWDTGDPEPVTRALTGA